MGLVFLTAVSRYWTRSHVLYDIDSVNFAMALDHFDPAVHQPHPPGYFLYVVLGRLMRAVIPDANAALVTISILCSCVTVWLIYRLAGEWFGRGAGIWAGMLAISSPLVWFHGTVALTYIVEMAFSAGVGYLCWRAVQGAPGPGLAAAGLTGISAGFRQSSALFLLPLVLYSLRGSGIGIRLRAGGIFLLTVLAWWIPMVYASGGVSRYAEALWSMWSIVPGKVSPMSPWIPCPARCSTWTTVPGKVSTETSGMAMIAGRAILVSLMLGAVFGPSLLLYLMRIRCRVSAEIRRFAVVWILPALSFFVLVFFKVVNGGYLLIATPALFALLGARIAAQTRARTAVGGLLLTANVAIGFYGPWYFCVREVQSFEEQLAHAVAMIRGRSQPENTAIVGFDSHFLGYRHAAYYLPEYRVLQYPEVPFASGPRVFSVRDRRTEVTEAITLAGISNVAVFPLAEDPQYRAFVREALKRVEQLPHRGMSCVGRDLCLFPAEALPMLFPRTVSRTQGVYRSAQAERE